MNNYRSPSRKASLQPRLQRKSGGVKKPKSRRRKQSMRLWYAMHSGVCDTPAPYVGLTGPAPPRMGWGYYEGDHIDPREYMEKQMHDKFKHMIRTKEQELEEKRRVTPEEVEKFRKLRMQAYLKRRAYAEGQAATVLLKPKQITKQSNGLAQPAVGVQVGAAESVEASSLGAWEDSEAGKSSVGSADGSVNAPMARDADEGEVSTC